MTLEEIKKKVASDEYSFLRENEHLGDRVCLLTLGGSHAYGTNVDTSDLDVRGIAVCSKNEILTNQKFEQFTNSETDTVIYSFDKIISLLSDCNPNTIELLGCKPEHYLYVNDIGKSLLENKSMFLSKRCIHSFGGYANSQLRRLENLSCRYVEQDKHEKYILDSIENASVDFKERYFSESENDFVKLYIDKAVNPEMTSEIFMDVSFKHYPLRDWCGMWNEMKSIVSSYNKIGQRNRKAIDHGKIGKHMAHLLRLYLMCIDILEQGEIITYREKDHDLLMSIRNGEFLDENEQPKQEFYEILNYYEGIFNAAKESTKLPEKPDYKRINEFLAGVNESVVKGGC